MKSSVENEEKLKLCKKDLSSECTELHHKFAVKHINSLICASYLITIVIALGLATYIHYVDVRQTRANQINLERLVESELSKLKDYNSLNNERLHG
jgi:hypothetical protein